MLHIAGVALQETRAAEADGPTVRVAGRHGWTVYPMAEVQAAHDNVLALLNRTVPVVFTEKAQLTGFYRVTAAASQLTYYADGAVQHATWQLTLERIGAGRDVEVESRVPTVGRVTDHATAPVFWHAPAVGAGSYFTGTTVASGTTTRTSSDGPVTVHTGIPAGVSPRWTATPAGYLAGSARLSADGIRRVGATLPDGGVWEVHNGLVLLSSPGVDGAVQVACWDGGQWRSETRLGFTVAGAALTGLPETTVLRNDPEEVAVRLTYATTVGRTTVDLSLRRGARFVTGVIKRHAAATLGVVRTVAQAGTTVTGGVRATADDADGNRYVIGSSKTVTADTTTGGISKTSQTRLDFFTGHEVNGATAQTGDAYTALLGQYLGSSGEVARVVRR